jgi:3',5'-cyclic AMP phosphodiesterase CpdA
VIKKFKGRDCARGLALLLALALLFMGLSRMQGPPPPYGPTLRERNDTTPSNSFQFAFFSDTHKGWGVLKPILKELTRGRYSFAIIGGDIVAKNSEDRYLFFLRELAEAKVKIPFYFVPGNHDASKDNGAYSMENFEKYCGPGHYWFSWGNASFIVLNDAHITISDDQFRWLETTLGKLRETRAPIFVFMHVPPFDPREGKRYCLPQDVSDKLMRLMEKFSVDYVFSGHLHCYFRAVIKGVTYVGAPSAGGRPRCSNPSYGYIQVGVRGQELKDSVIKVEKDWWPQLKGNIEYELCVRSPYLLPFLTLVLGQSSLYLFVL